jgi:hypothetical protein
MAVELTKAELAKLEADFATLTPKERELVEDCLRDFPLLTPITALHALRAAGM